MTEPLRPFCASDPAAREAFDGWVERLRAVGVEVGEADAFIVGLLAVRTARLEQLSRAIAAEADGATQLKLVEAERRAAAAVQASLDHLERALGVAAAAEAPAQLRATGTSGPAPGRVISFAVSSAKPKSALGQRLAAAVARSAAPLTMAALRRSVAGSEGDFRRALRDALACGAVRREGSGTKGRPFVYLRGGS